MKMGGDLGSDGADEVWRRDEASRKLDKFREFERRLEERNKARWAERDYSSVSKQVRIVGTEVIFESLAACARHFRLSEKTVRGLIEDQELVGDVGFEWVED